MNADSQWSKQEACFARATRVYTCCSSLSITTPVSHLANEFDVRSVLHGQVSMAAANQVLCRHEAINGCKLKACFVNMNLGTT